MIYSETLPAFEAHIVVHGKASDGSFRIGSATSRWRRRPASDYSEPGVRLTDAAPRNAISGQASVITS
jgi:hypothetical protein